MDNSWVEKWHAVSAASYQQGRNHHDPCMGAHHAQDGLRVNCVCPGMVYTLVAMVGMRPDGWRVYPCQ